MLTRTRVAGLAIGLAAAGGLVAGLAAAWNGQPAAPATAGLVTRPATSPSSPSRDNADAQPAAPGAAKPLLRPAATPGSASNGQSNTEPAPPAAASPPPAAPRPSSPSYYTINNKAHDLCLNAMNHVDTANVDVATCNRSWYQDWLALKDGSADQVVNKESGLCLTADSIANGANVVIATCHGYHNQLWLPDGARLYLEAASSGICLNGVPPATNESNADAATCASGTNQQWSW